ncbi:membrane stabilizing protein MspA [Staphylococcus delphini]|uniref:membrane stabilizing protein MspA n=1 Tax=Staphylococcus delphini TaxID=53344 RepID=UPI00031371B8|nr:membrane stabilizing protein MspA [Staphylococcus delphini]
MLAYLILLPLMYLFVAYISIFKMRIMMPKLLRVIMGLLLIIVVATSLVYYPVETWWVFVVLILLIGNVEITAFKHSKNDEKGVRILNMMSLFILVIYIVLVAVFI